MSEIEYLVTYGQGSFFGRFRAVGNFLRDEAVVVRSDRGEEFGIVREHARNGSIALVGDIVRRPTYTDHEVGQQHRDRVPAILVDAQRSADAAGLPLLFLDGEILLDGSQAILSA